METIINMAKQFRFYAAILALAALVVATAVVITTSPTMAQTNPDPASTPTPTPPKPCGPRPGPGLGPDFEWVTPNENPDATVSRGHYAIFDGYWDSEDKVLSPNLCPPSVVHDTVTTKVGKKTVTTEVSTRTASNIDLRQTVTHIDDAFKYTLTEEDLQTYSFFELGDADEDGVDDAIGQSVWWLKADDDEGEAATGGEAGPEFHIGFSAALFDLNDWYLADDSGSDKGAKPLQYEFEVIREPGIPVEEQGHLFAFDDVPDLVSPSGEGINTADWNSSAVDANALALYPRDYYHYQWAFTKPGTYIVSVQLKGHVRQKGDPRRADAPADWKPISEKLTETSEVIEYVFHVGPLVLNEAPAFEVERSVEENSAVGTLVGDPIPVYSGDDDTLTFSLTGPGHSLFSVEADTDGDAQIKVAGNINYEDFGDSTSEYRLTLGVSDNKDHEGNADDIVDSRISVKINVTDVANETLAITAVADPPGGTQTLGDEVVLTGTVTESPVATSELQYALSTVDSTNRVITVDIDSPTVTVTGDGPGTFRYYIGVSHRTGLVSREFESNPIEITWTARPTS